MGEADLLARLRAFVDELQKDGAIDLRQFAETLQTRFPEIVRHPAFSFQGAWWECLTRSPAKRLLLEDSSPPGRRFPAYVGTKIERNRAPLPPEGGGFRPMDSL